MNRPAIINTAVCWLSPVKANEEQTAEEVIENLVGLEKIFAFSDRTIAREQIEPGDWICFYATNKGIVAHAKVYSVPERKPHPSVRFPEKYPWVLRVEDAELYLNEPVVIDADARRQLDAFAGSRDPDRHWGWFVQVTHRITKHDFDLLTRAKARG